MALYFSLYMMMSRLDANGYFWILAVCEFSTVTWKISNGCIKLLENRTVEYIFRRQIKKHNRSMKRKKSAVKMLFDGSNWHTRELVEIAWLLFSSNWGYFITNVTSETERGVVESHKMFSFIYVLTIGFPFSFSS